MAKTFYAAPFLEVEFHFPPPPIPFFLYFFFVFDDLSDKKSSSDSTLIEEYNNDGTAQIYIHIIIFILNDNSNITFILIEQVIQFLSYLLYIIL